jgi:hypothetical protein
MSLNSTVYQIDLGGGEFITISTYPDSTGALVGTLDTNLTVEDGKFPEEDRYFAAVEGMLSTLLALACSSLIPSNDPVALSGAVKVAMQNIVESYS